MDYSLCQEITGSFGQWFSLCIFIFSLVLALAVAAKKLDIVKPLLILGIGLALADFVLMLDFGKDAMSKELAGGSAIRTIGSAFSYAIMTMTQMVTLDASYEEIFKYAGKSTSVLLLISIYSILMPIVWGSVVLTLFESFASYLMYQIFSCFVPVYFFSELHDQSLSLAENIFLKNNKKCLCIFCSVNENTPSELKEKAKDIRCLLFKKSEANYIKNTSRKQIFFELSENQDDNLDRTLELIKKYIGRYGEADYSAVKIFLYSEQDEASFVLGSVDKKGLPVIVINRDRFIANDLLFNYPLFTVISPDEKKLSILIVGAGKTGMELLKTCLWCGQLGEDYALEVTVLDKNADEAKKSLQLECPEFFSGEYMISFIEEDATHADFIDKIDSKCSSANYICVCLGNDELNIRTALHLRSYYQRKNIKADKNVFIAAMIRNDSKNRMLAQNISDFTVFGGDNLVYSTSVIDSEFERLALNVHQVYMNDEKDKKNILKDYYKSEYNIKSDRANALHIRYKMFLLGYDMQVLADSERFLRSEDFSLSEDDVKKLAKVEHERWNAYTRSEGWCRASLEQISATKNKSSKIPSAKLHACLCSWKELDEVSEYFGIDYKKYDADFVRKIPKILGIYENDTNITQIRCVLAKREVK